MTCKSICVVTGSMGLMGKLLGIASRRAKSKDHPSKGSKNLPHQPHARRSYKPYSRNLEQKLCDRVGLSSI